MYVCVTSVRIESCLSKKKKYSNFLFFFPFFFYRLEFPAAIHKDAFYL